MLFKVTSRDGQQTTQIEATSARDAGMMMMSVWKVGVEVERIKSQPKMIKARKDYTCDCCGNLIRAGKQYRKKTSTIGNPSKQTLTSDGIMFHGISFVERVCAVCVAKSEGKLV